MAKMTILQHVAERKEAYPSSIIFVRNGPFDFVEVFGDDAKLVHGWFPEYPITTMVRPTGEQVEMLGFPCRDWDKVRDWMRDNLPWDQRAWVYTTYR